MTTYYLEVISPHLSIELDSDINFYHHYKVGDIIEVHMYSGLSFPTGAKVCLYGSEYDAKFTSCWDSVNSKKLSIASAIHLKYVADITININRDDKLSQLGI